MIKVYIKHLYMLYTFIMYLIIHFFFTNSKNYFITFIIKKKTFQNIIFVRNKWFLLYRYEKVQL